MRRRVPCWLVGLAVLLSSVAGRAADQTDGPLVYAAASLTDVLQQIGAVYARERRKTVRFSFGSSATLARQIEAGARAELFLSADQDWMDYVEQRGLIRNRSRIDLLGNRLVLVAPAASTVSLPIAPGMPLGVALGPNGRLSLADPASVPAGKYARAALETLGVWKDVESRIVASENVRMALMFVARGEAPLGVVYLTDAKAEPKVRVVGEFPVGAHAPIVYPAAATRNATAAALEFLDYLSGPAARARFDVAGFTSPRR